LRRIADGAEKLKRGMDLRGSARESGPRNFDLETPVHRGCLHRGARLGNFSFLFCACHVILMNCLKKDRPQTVGNIFDQWRLRRGC
jgi:hypothetical protein